MKFSDLTTIGIGGELSKYNICNDGFSLLDYTYEYYLNNLLDSGYKTNSKEYKELLPVIVGDGSNLLPPDGQFDKQVFVNKAADITIFDDSFNVESGCMLEDMIDKLIDNGVFAFTALSGIPGTVGGAIVQNAGAYGSEISDYLIEISIFDFKKGKYIELSKNQLKFDYRYSKIKNDPSILVLSARFNINKNFELPSRLTDIFGAKSPKTASDFNNLKDLIIAERAKKSMIYEITDINSHGCGSFFKNPVVPLELIEDNEIFENIPSYEVADPKSIKLSAAALIEQSDLPKGFTLNGRAGLSHNHTLAIVNFGGATRADVDELCEHIKKQVFEKFNVSLEEEVVRL
ncbi:MAG: UDP-N-acetylmuramate dehydrogenase [Bifidobacteriaceae bacterium]|jgi:UDP-N-acetylmuramate dehydrogenase|nr:UDP-N-acetylmuramate dehydrogenase [Bifidobacteriaceae bacterium]